MDPLNGAPYFAVISIINLVRSFVARTGGGIGGIFKNFSHSSKWGCHLLISIGGEATGHEPMEKTLKLKTGEKQIDFAF